MIDALLVLAFAAPAFAEGLFWKDRQGNPVPDTAYRRSVNGVGGWLVVTPDENWEEKWNTREGTTPYFAEADTVAEGKRVYILTFIGNPGRSSNGDVNVTCDIEVQRPDGT
jgi:hypothetical protein